MIFTKRFRYRFGDIDDAGIAYYPSFFHYFHCAFEDWWSDGLNAPYDKVLHDEKFGLPAVHIESDFLVPIRYGDEPDIHLGILEMGTTSVKFAYWMTLEGEDRPLCRATITTVSVNMETFAKQPIPDKWREAFAAFVIDESEFPGAP
jgi:4-hydroxybenzoyl-CoA thioesterase